MVVGELEPQRFAQVPGAARQVVLGDGKAVWFLTASIRNVVSLDDPAAPQQAPLTDTLRCAHNIDVVVNAIRKINVEAAGRAKHRSIALCFASIGVRGSVLLTEIRLYLGENNADSTMRQYAPQ
ncbi:hypothetical protein BJP07_08105 [Corynebacterium sp. NML130628]|nr:hypothetical protein BJP07_08105 [Corynebacterium sp. NML130628]